MDPHALAALEYPAISERLAAAAATAHGAELALGLVPASHADEVYRRQTLTGEAIALLDGALEPSLGGIADVRAAVAQAVRGVFLGPSHLREIATTAEVSLAARSAIGAAVESAPTLHELVSRVDPTLASLAESIQRAVEDDGSDLRDNASPALRRLRAELRAGRARVADEIRRLARSTELRDHLQEEFVAERGGRPVLAVRTSARGNVPGIVHDSSGSGQTLFIEPFAIVELNNKLSEAAGAEREEVERILGELSSQVGARADALNALVEATGHLDLALACGALSRRWRGVEVRVADEVRLLGVRHPLLDDASAVPIDLDLGALRVLVVSGPNAGGKTVALKALGLCAALHQAGLRPPASAAVLPIFDRVLVDIGDQQSIAMSLSTFSGHLRALVEILREATGRSLVLLDELASGTDPAEGSALAQALLARLEHQARLTVVTTHFPELKEWASATDGVANAATGFDPDTQAPLYRVMLGRPGVSHALRIAERLGLDEAVVADARSRIVPERLRIEELLADAEASERAAGEARAQAVVEREDAAASTLRASERERELAAEVEAVRASAAREREIAIAEAERDLAEARAELEALREEIRVARRRERDRRRAGPERAGEAERSRDRSLGQAVERSGKAERALRSLEALPLRVPLAPGDPVVAPGLGVRGTIVAIDGDEAEVHGPGGLRVRIALARLRPDAARGEPSGPPVAAVQVLASARSDVPDELDVRRFRAQEAREAVRSLVDDAALAGLPSVRIVHGRGTGAMRAAVRDELSRHPLVDRHESEAADGATLAHLEPPTSPPSIA